MKKLMNILCVRNMLNYIIIRIIEFRNKYNIVIFINEKNIFAKKKSNYHLT